MRTFFSVIFVLVAIFTGGCSLYFLFGFWMEGNSDWIVFTLPGFIVALLAILGVRAINRGRRQNREGGG